MASDSKKRLALAIIDFLSTSLKDGTIDASDSESVEIATNCIAESFHVDPSNEAAVKDALGGQNLLSIYGVYEKNFYTQALEIAPLNPIYLSNRAAAYSNLNQHEFAKNDAELATATDPKYTKAWSRLGLALFALGDAKGSMEAYKKGIDAEGNGGSEAMKRGYETAKRRVDEEGGVDELETSRGGPGAGGGMPDLSGLASMLGGGGGGAGGMPDLAGLMNNPMMRQMAQNLMSNPDMMNNLMNNPQLRDMANRFGGGGAGGGGGGMPDMSALMNDPNIAEMARNFMGGAGGAGAGRGGGQ
ncbi:hypothetical protein BDZ85DRAFT_120985 [Elsinoe ampelina]|uniref:SGTA homodimerisation domain-containing protein n=1 Tax=Elsinoe ampelina TaxID=302913 RepID=A0A6A6GCF3_9PEZI|nr:hypothetical protein BDZ85DRAFT_120985 [Elsinoe ampelina]